VIHANGAEAGNPGHLLKVFRGLFWSGSPSLSTISITKTDDLTWHFQTTEDIFFPLAETVISL
jgi:hypothetical protein